MKSERIGEATLTVKVDGVRVFSLLLTGRTGRQLAAVLNEAKSVLGRQSKTGRPANEDIADLIIAAVATETAQFDTSDPLDTFLEDYGNEE